MTRILSTYLFVKRKLTPALVAELAASKVNAVELFCARPHFDYRSSDVVKELASALTDHNPRRARRAQQPSAISVPGATVACPSRSAIWTVPGASKPWTRSSAPSIWPRIISFFYLVQHLGSSREPNDPRLFEDLQFPRTPAYFRQAARRHHCARKYSWGVGHAREPAAIHRRYAADRSAPVL